MDSYLNAETYTPYLRWMASTQQWKLRKNGDDEILDFGNAVFDISNTKFGWGAFSEGNPPDWQWDGDNGQGPKPTQDHKRGFSVEIYAPKMLGDDQPVAIWESTSRGACLGMEALIAQVDDEQVKSKLPLVKYTGANSKRIGKGSTSIPDLEITGYVDRPEGFVTETPIGIKTPVAPVGVLAQAAPVETHTLSDSSEF